MDKHAYLIIAHNNFYILENLIKLLDDERNDIYIHIDKKVKKFNFNFFEQLTKKSKVFFTKRIDVSWSGYSQIECELILLEESKRNKYEYYHLISGVDLPIKSQDYIHDFFERNKGKEFININKINKDTKFGKMIFDRIRLYHFFNNKINLRDNKLRIKVIKLFNKGCILFQKICRVNRYEGDIWFGGNWFSITDKAVKYILDNKEFIRKNYKFTSCADEIFIQNLFANNKEILNSVYNMNSNESNLRYIDWTRGNPYVFTVNDFESFMKSNCLFARKFSAEKDKEIIDKIYEYLKNESIKNLEEI